MLAPLIIAITACGAGVLYTGEQVPPGETETNPGINSHLVLFGVSWFH